MVRRVTPVDPNVSPLHAFAHMVTCGRLNEGLSQTDLGRAIHYSATYIIDTEKARKLPPLEVALALADQLHLERDEVMLKWQAANAWAAGDERAEAAVTEAIVEPPEPSVAEPAPTDTPGSTEAPLAEAAGVSAANPAPAEGRQLAGRVARPVKVAVGCLLFLLLGTVGLLTLRDDDAEPGDGTGPITGDLAPTTSALGPTTTLTTRLPPVTLLQDDFSQRRGWPNRESAGVVFRYVDGAYRIGAREAGSAYYSVAPTAAPGPNVRVEADAWPLSKADTPFGVACRVGPAQTTPPYYAAVIAPTGYWRISRYNGAPDREAHNLSTAGPDPNKWSSVIRAEGVNRIAMECAGGPTAGSPVTIRLFVNGLHIAEVTDPAGLAPGQAGLTVSATEVGEVNFDNVVVARL